MKRTTKTTKKTPNREALYYQALQMAFDTFLLEEQKEQLFTEKLEICLT